MLLYKFHSSNKEFAIDDKTNLSLIKGIEKAGFQNVGKVNKNNLFGIYVES